MKPGYADFGFENNFYQIIAEFGTDPDKEDKGHRLFDKLFKNANSLPDAFSKKYRIKKILSCKIILFRANGKTKEADELIWRHLEIDEFREKAVSLLILDKLRPECGTRFCFTPGVL